MQTVTSPLAPRCHHLGLSPFPRRTRGSISGSFRLLTCIRSLPFFSHRSRPPASIRRALSAADGYLLHQKPFRQWWPDFPVDYGALDFLAFSLDADLTVNEGPPDTPPISNDHNSFPVITSFPSVRRRASFFRGRVSHPTSFVRGNFPDADTFPSPRRAARSRQPSRLPSPLFLNKDTALARRRDLHSSSGARDSFCQHPLPFPLFPQ